MNYLRRVTKDGLAFSNNKICAESSILIATIRIDEITEEILIEPTEESLADSVKFQKNQNNYEFKYNSVQFSLKKIEGKYSLLGQFGNNCQETYWMNR